MSSNFFQKKKKKSQNQNVLLNVFTAIKCICWPYWAFLQTEMKDFLTFSYTSTREITIAFHIPQTFKRYHFRAEPPCISHGREYPLGFRSRRCRILYRVSLFTLRDSFFNRFSVLENSNRLTPCLYFHVVFYRL